MTTRTESTFGYAAEIDPTMSTFGWKVIVLTYLAVLAPLLGAPFPRDAATEWSWIWIALGCAFLTVVVNVLLLARMIAEKGLVAPTMLVVLLQVCLGTVAVGILNFALSDTLGIYRPLIFVPTLLLAMIAGRAIVTISWVVAWVTLLMSTLAQGMPPEVVYSFSISYGTAWGVAAIMVHLLATTALRSDRQTQALADAATIAAQAGSLSEGIDKMLPIVGEWEHADRVAAYLVEGGNTELVATWPPNATRATPPIGEEVAAAMTQDGVHIDGGRIVLVAPSIDDESVVLVLEGRAQPRYERQSHRFNQRRMALQLEILVKRSRYIERLADLGLTDGLTSLPNRRALTDRLTHEIRGAQRRGEPLSMAMIDLDDFKNYNDTFGHLAGDELLREFATALRARLRGIDFVARYGGEEFCVLFPDTDSAGAATVLEAIHRWSMGSSGRAPVTFSAGIATWDGEEGPEGLIERADTALYAAKAAGKDRTVVQP